MPRTGKNIYKRKDGRWEGRYKASRDENGKRVLLNTIWDLAGTVGTAFTSLSLPEISGPQMALAGWCGWRSDQQPQYDHQRSIGEYQWL